MNIDALNSILSEMQRSLDVPNLIPGKLYWVIPKECTSIEDVSSDIFEGYVIRPSNNKDTKKDLDSYWNAHYLVLREVKKKPFFSKEYEVHSFDKPVMFLEDASTEFDQKDFITLLVSDKVYKRIVFCPMKIDWKLIPVNSDGQDDI